MRKPNRNHKKLVDSIMKEKDEDVLQHKMLHLPFWSHAEIEKSTRPYARFTMHNGKVFRAYWRWLDDSSKALKETFKEALYYRRMQRHLP